VDPGGQHFPFIEICCIEIGPACRQAGIGNEKWTFEKLVWSVDPGVNIFLICGPERSTPSGQHRQDWQGCGKVEPCHTTRFDLVDI